MPLPKGFRHSEETKRRIGLANSISLKGRKLSLKHRKKIGASLLGRKISDKQKKFLSESRIGKNNPMYGKKLSDDRKKQISKASSGKKNYFYGKYFIGEKNHNWRGGVTSLNEKIRKSSQYIRYRNAGFKRDNYTCQICYLRGAELNFDHFPKTFSSIIVENKIKSLRDARLCKELWDLNNGRTLCIDCHKKTDTYGGRTRIR